MKQATRDVRRGLVQAQQSESGFNLYMFETLACGVASGLFFHSWFVGGGAFLAALVLIFIPILRMVVSVIFSAGWGLIAYLVGVAFFSTQSAGYVIGGVIFLSVLGLHLTAIQRASDTDPAI